MLLRLTKNYIISNECINNIPIDSFMCMLKIKVKSPITYADTGNCIEYLLRRIDNCTISILNIKTSIETNIYKSDAVVLGYILNDYMSVKNRRFKDMSLTVFEGTLYVIRDYKCACCDANLLFIDDSIKSSLFDSIMLKQSEFLELQEEVYDMLYNTIK